jgi:hypothetical protein
MQRNTKPDSKNKPHFPELKAPTLEFVFLRGTPGRGRGVREEGERGAKSPGMSIPEPGNIKDQRAGKRMSGGHFLGL